MKMLGLCEVINTNNNGFWRTGWLDCWALRPRYGSNDREFIGVLTS